MVGKLEDLLMAKVDTLTGYKYSPSLNRVMEMIDEPMVQLEIVSELIAEDQQLANDIVRISAQRTNKNVQDIRQVVRMVGLNTIRDFLSAIAKADDKAEGVDEGAFRLMQGKLWIHCQLTAICCQLLAKELDYPRVTLAYTAGLFHDLGKAVLNAYALEEITSAITLTQAAAMDLRSAEDHALGFNHAYFSSKILRHWEMPEAVVEAVRHHHAPQEAEKHRLLAKILHLADVAVNCQQTKLPIGITLFPVDKGVLEASGVSKERLAALAEQAAALFEKSQRKVSQAT